MMNLISFATSRWGVSVVIFLCRVLPRKFLYDLARGAASYLANQKELPFISALRANMAIVHRLPEDDPQLSQIVSQLLENTLCSYADLFRVVAAGPEEIYAACKFDTSLIQIVEDCRASGQGLLLVGAHSCCFDILLLGLKRLFPTVQVLTKSNPTGSSSVMNEIRTQHGINITPISVQSLKTAVEALRSGGIVVIAADLPSEEGEELTFFGCKSRMLIGHSRLALGTNAQMVIGISQRVGAGAYRAEATLVPRPPSTGNKKQDTIHWAQKSLKAVEEFISKRPDEWLMPIPVWPGLAAEPGAH